jgi:hypothetical protein
LGDPSDRDLRDEIERVEALIKRLDATGSSV